MKPVYCTLLFVACAFAAPLSYAKPPAKSAEPPEAAPVQAPPPPQAATSSLLRVTCEGEDIGAEVSINGKYKGECPVDIQLKEGSYKLLVEKHDATYDRVFAQDIRMGDGIVKKVEAVLSKQLTAAGQKLEDERLQKQQAKIVARRNTTPPRPKLPFVLSEDIWRTIEASEAYRNLPPSRTIEVSYSSHQIANNDYPNKKSLKIDKQVSRTTNPLNDRCTIQKQSETSAYSENDSKEPSSTSEKSYYRCGFIELGSTYDAIARIDELSGTLFPMRSGNIMKFSYRSASHRDPKPEHNTEVSDTWAIGRQLLANELNSTLAGNAWEVKHHHTRTNNEQISINVDGKTITYDDIDYYLEDIGVMWSRISESVADGSITKKIIPQKGKAYHFSNSYYSEITMTYDSYDWKVGN